MENLKIEIGGVNLSDLANRMERIEKHLKSYRIGSRLRYKKSEVMEALKDTAK